MPEVAERTDRAQYETDLESAATLGGPDWIREVREAGAAAFRAMEYPTHREEAWRNTDIKPIVGTEFRSILGDSAGRVSAADLKPHLLGADVPRVVFVDGSYNAELSALDGIEANVRIASIADALSNNDATARAHLNQYVPTTNAFVALNNAFLHDGALVEVSANAKIDSPIHVLFVSTAAEVAASYPRTLVVLGESAELNLVESYVGLNDETAYFTNAVSEYVVGANAKLHRHKVVQEGARGFHLETSQTEQDRDSFFEAFAMNLTGQIGRNELRVAIRGENSECSLNGLYLNDGDRVVDNALNVEHVAPNCRSRMVYKGVLDGSSDAVFTGKVYVHQSAQKTDSDQLNQNLLLTDTASIDTRPQLEIFADDVKCTHGATIGGFPEELIFYFRSRGIDAGKANGILTFGFGDEVVDEIGVESLKDMLADYVFEKYKPVS